MSALNTAAEPGCAFDPSIPHSARIYSYWLGGKDHFPADRRERRWPGRATGWTAMILKGSFPALAVRRNRHI